MAPLMQIDLKGMGIGPGQGCHVAKNVLAYPARNARGLGPGALDV